MEHKINFAGSTIKIEQFNAQYVHMLIKNIYGDSMCITMTKEAAKAVACDILAEADSCADLSF